MIVSTLRLYVRIRKAFNLPNVDGLHADAESCLSFLVLHLRAQVVSLPDNIARHYIRLPEE